MFAQGEIVEWRFITPPPQPSTLRCHTTQSIYIVDEVWLGYQPTTKHGSKVEQVFIIVQMHCVIQTRHNPPTYCKSFHYTIYMAPSLWPIEIGFMALCTWYRRLGWSQRLHMLCNSQRLIRTGTMVWMVFLDLYMKYMIFFQENICRA